MKLVVPDYYEKFRCIADRCKHSCCIGWEVDIDEDSYQYYQLVEGSFGERLRSELKTEEDHFFQMDEKMRCPFLNQKNLCDICIQLGEESLSEVCTEYPRFTLEYGDKRLKCMGLSCEEVGRLLFQEKKKLTLVEREIPEEDFGDFWEEEDDFFEEEEFADQEPMEEETEDEEFVECGEDSCLEEIEFYEEATKEAIRILEDEEKSFEEREARFIEHALKIEKKKREKRKDQSKENVPEEWDTKKILLGLQKKLADTRIKESYFDKLEVLDQEWSTVFGEVKAFYRKATKEQEERKRQYADLTKTMKYQETQILTYFCFRYLMKAVYDGVFLGRALFALLSLSMMRDMSYVRIEAQGTFSLEDRIDIARIYSREVEHSEENVELLVTKLEEWVEE